MEGIRAFSLSDLTGDVISTLMNIYCRLYRKKIQHMTETESLHHHKEMVF